jgi:hypothetical protein
MGAAAVSEFAMLEPMCRLARLAADVERTHGSQAAEELVVILMRLGGFIVLPDTVRWREWL